MKIEIRQTPRHTVKMSLFFMALLISTITYAQKADTKLVLVRYTQPPKKPLAENITTYHTGLKNQAGVFSPGEASAQDAIQLQGYNLVDNENADVRITLTISAASYESAIEKVEYKKKINDSTYVDRTGGMFTVTSYLRYSYKIVDHKNGDEILSSDSKAETATFKSQRYNSYNDAVYASNSNKGKEAKKLYQQAYAQVLSNINGTVNGRYGYPEKSVSIPIARGKGRKFDYSDLEKAFNDFEKAAELKKESGITPEVKQLVHESMKAWKAAIAEYSPSRKARIGDKNIGHVNMNMAAAHFLLEEWDECVDYIEIVDSTKGQKGYADFLMEKINDLQDRSGTGPEETVTASK